jgi:hypothetical protein
MDSGKIFICNLSKGRIGEDNSALLGAMIITRMQLAAMSRVDTPEQKRRDFFLYVDEFQNFATESFANILSEARKYRLSLVLAHQYIGQLMTGDSTSVRDAVFGNVGTIISFRVGAADAEFLEQEFMPEFLQNDFVNLAKANIYIKLMIDGVSSRPFSAETLPPPTVPFTSYRDVIIKNSRDHYGTPKAAVESQIASEWRNDAGVASALRAEKGKERRLSEVLVSNPRSGTPPPLIARNVRDVEPRSKTQEDARPMTVAIPKEEERAAQKAPPITEILRGTAPQAPKKVLHPNVDINELKRAIAESLKKPKDAAAEADERNRENTQKDIAALPVRLAVRNDPARPAPSERPSIDAATASAKPESGSYSAPEVSEPRSDDRRGNSPTPAADRSSDTRNGNERGAVSERPPQAAMEKRVPDGKNLNYHGTGAVPHAAAHRENAPKIDITMLRKAIGDVQKMQSDQKDLSQK